MEHRPRAENFVHESIPQAQGNKTANYCSAQNGEKTKEGLWNAQMLAKTHHLFGAVILKVYKFGGQAFPHPAWRGARMRRA
jgi:hypothetical protein